MTRASTSPPGTRPAVRGISLGTLLLSAGAWAADCPAFLNHDFLKLHSTEHVNVCKAYTGKPLLIVNTASHCGYTPQFKGLEALNQKYKNRGWW